MKPYLVSLLALAATYIPSAWAQTTAAAAESVSAPTCGLTCIVTAAMQNSTCALTDTACICGSVALNEAANLCVVTSCSKRDQLATQRYSKTTCGVPGEDRTQLVSVLGVVFLALGLLAFALRCVSRLSTPAISWGPDDWFMVAAVLFMIPLGVLSVPLANLGLGKDIWNVEPDNITEILYLYFWDELFYLAALPFTKISILFFYLKIFPKKEIKIAVWVLIGLNVAYFITFEVISIWQCDKIPGAWRAWDGTYEVTCRDINMQGWMAAALNLALDLAVLILPLPELYKLSMSKRKKFQILAMFCVGFFVTAVSLLRLQSLAHYATTANFTQDYVEIGYWSTIEVPVGVICACMPAIRSLVGRVFPKVFGTTQQKSDYKLSDHSSGMLWSGRMPGGGHRKQIRVKTEWTVRSHNLEDNASEVELVDTPTRKNMKAQEAMATTPTLPRPASNLAQVETTCESGSLKKSSWPLSDDRV